MPRSEPRKPARWQLVGEQSRLESVGHRFRLGARPGATPRVRDVRRRRHAPGPVPGPGPVPRRSRWGSLGLAGGVATGASRTGRRPRRRGSGGTRSSRRTARRRARAGSGRPPPSGTGRAPVVGVLGHHRQSGLRRLGPAFGRPQVGGLQDAFDPESAGTAWPRDRPRSASGSVRARSAGSAPAGRAATATSTCVMALPLVDAAGTRFARSIGVVGEHDPLGEVAAGARKCSSPSAVPHVATALGSPAWKKAMTSV